jgi:Zinc carboxypeptidase
MTDMPYLSSAAMDSALAGLASAHSLTCTKLTLASSSENRPISAIQIKGSVPESRIPVLVTAGMHAREWAPPDAILSFATRLLTAHKTGTDIIYPTFTSGGVTYGNPNYRVTAGQVSTILARFNLIILPLVNPDGRDFSVLGVSGHPTRTEMMWRKNRRIIPQHVPPCRGVDINRNFPIAWNEHEYYRPDAARKVDVSDDSCDQLFKGQQPRSEIETQNVMSLAIDHRVEFYVDVHQQGRKLLFPWSIERFQSNDLRQNFFNPDKHHLPAVPSSGRDGKLGNAYGEFIPNSPSHPRGTLRNRLVTLANAMAGEIVTSAGSNATARARSAYRTMPAVEVYPELTVTGAAHDFIFSRQFRDPTWPTTCAFTIEAGLAKGNPVAVDPQDDDGGYWPDFFKQFPKIEREIHAGLFGLLRAI